MLEHVLTFLQSSCEDLVQLVYAVAQTLLDVLILYLSFFLVPKNKKPWVLIQGLCRYLVCYNKIYADPQTSLSIARTLYDVKPDHKGRHDIVWCSSFDTSCVSLWFILVSIVRLYLYLVNHCFTKFYFLSPNNCNKFMNKLIKSIYNVNAPRTSAASVVSTLSSSRICCVS